MDRLGLGTGVQHVLADTRLHREIRGHFHNMVPVGPIEFTAHGEVQGTVVRQWVGFQIVCHDIGGSGQVDSPGSIGIVALVDWTHERDDKIIPANIGKQVTHESNPLIARTAV